MKGAMDKLFSQEFDIWCGYFLSRPFIPSMHRWADASLHFMSSSLPLCRTQHHLHCLFIYLSYFLCLPWFLFLCIFAFSGVIIPTLSLNCISLSSNTIFSGYKFHQNLIEDVVFILLVFQLNQYGVSTKQEEHQNIVGLCVDFIIICRDKAQDITLYI